jgi:hypothetical protein
MYKGAMKTFLKTLLLLSSLNLAACATGGNETSRSLTEIVRAERGVQQDLPGCQIPPEMVGKPHTDIQKLKLTAPVRVIFPGNAVTTDNVSNRLNFKVDKKGIIKSVTCG